MLALLGGRVIYSTRSSLRDFSRNRGAGRCHFPPPTSQRKQMAASGNHSLSKLIILHPPAPTSQACLRPSAVRPVPQKIGTEPTSNLLTVHFVGPRFWWQWPVTFCGGCMRLVKTEHPTGVCFVGQPQMALVLAAPAHPLWKRTSTKRMGTVCAIPLSPTWTLPITMAGLGSGGMSPVGEDQHAPC